MKEETVSAVQQLCFIALMAGVMCLLGPLSIPIGPVPISVMTLLIYLSVYILGMKMGTISCVIYLMLGFVGLPVFAGYTGREIAWPDRRLPGWVYFSDACKRISYGKNVLPKNLVSSGNDCRDGGFVCIWDGMVCRFDGLQYWLRAFYVCSAVSDWGSGQNCTGGTGRAGSAQKAQSS